MRSNTIIALYFAFILLECQNGMLCNRKSLYNDEIQKGFSLKVNCGNLSCIYANKNLWKNIIQNNVITKQEHCFDVSKLLCKCSSCMVEYPINRKTFCAFRDCYFSISGTNNIGKCLFNAKVTHKPIIISLTNSGWKSMKVKMSQSVNYSNMQDFALNDGLNIQQTCTNSSCKLYDTYIWENINLCDNAININKILSGSKCLECKKHFARKSYLTYAFSNCDYYIIALSNEGINFKQKGYANLIPSIFNMGGSMASLEIKIKKGDKDNLFKKNPAPTYNSNLTLKEKLIIQKYHNDSQQCLEKSISHIKMINKYSIKENDPYKVWFGKYNNLNLKEVIKNLDSMKQSLNKMDIEYYYKEKDKGNLNLYGYVYLQETNILKKRKIYLGYCFFDNPMESVCTIIHELSHVIFFSKDITCEVAPNLEPIEMYGKENCKKLAKIHPEKAILNADNYGFFVQNFINKKLLSI